MVKIFGRDSCAPCKTLKALLTYKKIPFEYLEAEGSEYEALANQHGVSVPLVVIGEQVVVAQPPTVILRMIQA